METIENATQSEQSGLGMKMREMIIITTAANVTHWIVVGRTIKN
jgi:hypothetical protein